MTRLRIYKNNILEKTTGLVFKTTDPYRDSAWSNPVQYNAEYIDPDLFWDDDGTAYVATAGTNLQTINLETGTLGKPRRIWNGTTGIFLEGPHLYKKDGCYYLITAEGGSGLNHSVTIARSTTPRHFAFWRWPEKSSYAVSPPGHPETLRLRPSPASITAGYKNYTAGYELSDLTLVMRRQTDTLFEYSVDVAFEPKVRDEEVGVTVFLNQVQNINLGVVMLPANSTANSTNSTLAPYFRFLVSGLRSNEKNIPAPSIAPIPTTWLQDPIRLIIRAESETHYTFYAASSARPSETHTLGCAPATILSGGAGPFTGTLIGVYATSNGGSGTTPSYVSRWRYQGIAQAIADGHYEMAM